MLTCSRCDVMDETVELRTWCEPCGPNNTCEDCNNRHRKEVDYWTQEAKNLNFKGLL